MTLHILDALTGEVIEREFNAEEEKQHALDQDEAEAIQASNEAKAQAKAAVLNRLGITEDEAKLLLG